MRRPTLVLVLAAAIAALLPLAPSAAAIGPGGWDRLGVGVPATQASLDGAVYALNTDDPGLLLVGGNFTKAGGNTKASRIAAWNGIAWSAIGAIPLTNGHVNAIAYHAGKVYVGGTFQNAGGHADVDFLAAWDGSDWTSPCTSTQPGPAITGTVAALQVIGNTLYVGGAFANGAAIASADYLLACDMTTGVARSTVLADGDFTGGVYALTADSHGTLYAGGTFVNLDKIPTADHVAAYSGGAWHGMGSGPSIFAGAVQGHVRSLAAHGTDVYVGTDDVDVAGIATADHVVRWDGTNWHAVGSNTAGTNGWFPGTAFINALVTSGNLVFAAGSFQNANGITTADNIAYFDGSRWRPVGSDGGSNGPMIANLAALAVFRGRLHAAGNMTSAGGDRWAVSVAAYSLTQPDARITYASGALYLGDGTYSSTGVGEWLIQAIARGSSRTFWINIQNDGLVAASFKLKGTGAATGMTVRYFRGATNVTAAVKAGTYVTGSIPARSSVTLRLVVSLSKKSAATGTFLLRASSSVTTPSDAVKAIVKAH